MRKREADGLGTQLRRLLELMDGDLEQIYAENFADYVPRYTPVMKALADGESRTIKEIAELSSVSHSAASQTVSRMIAAGLIRRSIGADGRERQVRLTRKAKALLPPLKSWWAATDRAASSLEEEVGAQLGSILAATIRALERQPFRRRIERAARPRR